MVMLSYHPDQTKIASIVSAIRICISLVAFSIKKKKRKKAI
jgi:hypothetical protein